MKSYRLVKIPREKCPEHIFAKVLEMAPDSLSPLGGIKVEADVGEDAKAELVEKIVSYCRDSGLTWSSARGGGRPGTYGYEMVRCYESADLIGARFLILERQKQIQLEEERDEQGRLLMAASKARAGRKVGRIYPNWIIVSDSTRRILETGNFKGLEFGEVALKGTSVNAAKDPFWELKSSVTLPKMANTDRFVMVDSVPFNGDYSKTVWISDPPYRTGEIHYREADLKALGDFDIAYTFEHYMEHHRVLVISQRFYQHCLKHKIPLEVEPVRIDPD